MVHQELVPSRALLRASATERRDHGRKHPRVFPAVYRRTPLDIAVRVSSLCPIRLLGALLAFSAAAEAEEKVRFNRDVRPILSGNCFFCHGPDEKKREGHRRLDTRDGALAENDGVRAIVPGKPDASDLLTRITSHDKDELMPTPKSKKPPLTPTQIATLRKWIEQGAEYEGHWAFLPLSSSPPPVVKARAWPKNGIDNFVLAKLESENLAPSPEADRATLLRRVSLDLTGLLPSPEDVRAFTEDRAPDAYERLVDRLLASPHYGERWGRHWLDQARYADSNGYALDTPRAMWPYRDWVIKALNDDLPFDRFTIEQLAGDLLPKPTKSQIIATAFHRNTLINEEGGSKPDQFRVEAVIDRTNTTGAVWLGLTVGCAQCHTHKFDPITQREFYQLTAFFNSGEDVNSKGATIEVARGEIFGQPAAPTSAEIQSIKSPKHRVTQEEWERQELGRIEALPAEQQPADAFTFALKLTAAVRIDEQRKLVKAAFEKAVPKEKAAKPHRVDGQVVDLMVMQDLAKPRPTFLLQRGDYTRPDEKAGPLQPGVIAAVSAAFQKPPAAFLTRLDLARWLVSPENPLTPRVTMNRVWMRYFGRGLVETEEDFGTQGSPPTHPELLDWLGREFIRRGWSMKAMHRLIVTSATYRQSSKTRTELAERDPRNLLLARQDRVRVEAEIVRDAALSASGLLEPTIGGPSVHPPQPEGVYAFTQTGKKWTADTGPDRFRRALYTMYYRSAPYPLFGTFDAPDFQTVCTRRPRSDTPLQALTVANDPAFVELAQGLAARVLREVPAGNADARIRRAFALSLCREPSAKEFAILRAYHAAQLADFTRDATTAGKLLSAALAKTPAPAEAAALVAIARTLFNTDNFITRE